MNKLLIAALISFVSSWSFANGTSIEERIDTILALENDVDYGAYLASECGTCHNENSADKGIPVIHGKEAMFLVKALLEYKEKIRSNETMISIAGALGDEEIGALAVYFNSK